MFKCILSQRCEANLGHKSRWSLSGINIFN